MARARGFTLVDLLVVVFIIVVLCFFLLPHGHPQEAARRASCMNNIRQIGLVMFQYAADHDDRFMPLVDAAGSEVPAVDNEGLISPLPARSAFAVLLKEGYLTTTKVFVCPSSRDGTNRDWDHTTEYKRLTLAELAAGLKPENCSYGWDPTKRHDADAACAIIADKPSDAVSSANEGTAANNTRNHRGDGQNVFYNDGHVKWGTTPRPDSGDDPDLYTGAPGYQKSKTDAKIIP